MNSPTTQVRRSSAGRRDRSPAAGLGRSGLAGGRSPRGERRFPVARAWWARAKGCWGWLAVPPRLQGFEFCDQPWLRGVWREAYLDCLNFLFRTTRLYDRMYQPFSCWARQAGGDRVLDLCSGGGAHLDTLVRTARAAEAPLPRLVASDLFPDLGQYAGLRARHGDRLDFVTHSVDATRPGLPGCRLRCLFGGFHHFPPARARELLRDAVEHGDGLFVAEVFRRTWATVFGSLPNLLLLPAAPFFATRFRLRKLMVTTLFPVVPLLVVFDG